MNADHILVELRRLQAENAKLRAALKENGRHARRIQRARDCAGLLALWHMGHLPTDRTFAKSQGMAQRQWENGITLLRLARVCDQAGRWLHHDLAAIDARLDDAVIAANAAPEAYFARGNNHMRQ
jgi:hypothetical protein